MAMTMAAIAAFVLGFLAGLVIRKAPLWCGICGVTLKCPVHAWPPR
jgi:hypothetical protein